ncbi:hypothetical protein ACLOJK_026553 [Asimina triloba]
MGEVGPSKSSRNRFPTVPNRTPRSAEYWPALISGPDTCGMDSHVWGEMGHHSTALIPCKRAKNRSRWVVGIRIFKQSFGAASVREFNTLLIMIRHQRPPAEDHAKDSEIHSPDKLTWLAAEFPTPFDAICFPLTPSPAIKECVLGGIRNAHLEIQLEVIDSLVDAGNNNYIFSLSKANMLPNGIDFTPFQEPTGRYTNGRTTADLIGNDYYQNCQELGLEGFAPPYLAPTTCGDVVLGGVNYASGGGGILNETGKIFVGRINLDAQIDNYANTRQDIISRIRMSEALTLLRTAIFSVTMGSNDLINNYLFPKLPLGEGNVAPEVFIESMITKYRVQLTRPYSLDARKIIVVNVGPIGCIPYLRDTSPSTAENCIHFPNQLATSFNTKLKSLVAELNSNLEGVVFVYADIYSIVSDIVENYSSYGFECFSSACCAAAGRFGGLIPCSPSSKVYPDRSKYGAHSSSLETAMAAGEYVLRQAFRSDDRFHPRTRRWRPTTSDRQWQRCNGVRQTAFTSLIFFRSSSNGEFRCRLLLLLKRTLLPVRGGFPHCQISDPSDLRLLSPIKNLDWFPPFILGKNAEFTDRDRGRCCRQRQTMAPSSSSIGDGRCRCRRSELLRRSELWQTDDDVTTAATGDVLQSSMLVACRPTKLLVGFFPVYGRCSLPRYRCWWIWVADATVRWRWVSTASNVDAEVELRSSPTIAATHDHKSLPPARSVIPTRSIRAK